MIRRNVADQPILLGPLLTTAGVPQTAGAAVTVTIDGVPGVGAGTLVHVTDGVHAYTPTAAETDCNLLGLILTKAGAVASPVTVVTTRFSTQSVFTLANGGVLVDSLSAGALTQIDTAGVGGMTTDTVLVTVATPTDRLVDTDGHQLTAVTVGQALTALVMAILGDRAGVGTREITASLPGVAGTTVTAKRVSRAAIEATVVVPPAG